MNDLLLKTSGELRDKPKGWVLENVQAECGIRDGSEVISGNTQGRLETQPASEASYLPHPLEGNEPHQGVPEIFLTCFSFFSSNIIGPKDTRLLGLFSF